MSKKTSEGDEAVVLADDENLVAPGLAGDCSSLTDFTFGCASSRPDCSPSSASPSIILTREEILARRENEADSNEGIELLRA